jgi:hypothetical protein
MSNGFLSGLSSEEGSEDGSRPEWVPEGFTDLAGSDYNSEESEELNPSIRAKKVHSDFHNNLESGLGRDEMIKYVDNNLSSYRPEETVGLKIYLLDRLDSTDGHSEGELLGEEVFSIVKEFRETDGYPEFLQQYSSSAHYSI